MDGDARPSDAVRTELWALVDGQLTDARALPCKHTAQLRLWAGSNFAAAPDLWCAICQVAEPRKVQDDRRHSI